MTGRCILLKVRDSNVGCVSRPRLYDRPKRQTSKTSVAGGAHACLLAVSRPASPATGYSSCCQWSPVQSDTRPGASPGQTKWGGEYGWVWWRGVSCPKSAGRIWGYNLKLISTLHNDSIPETRTLGNHPSPPRGNALHSPSETTRGAAR